MLKCDATVSLAHVNSHKLCVCVFAAMRVSHQQYMYIYGEHAEALRATCHFMSFVVFVVFFSGDLDHFLQTKSFTQMINYCLAFEVIKKLINLLAVYF